MISSTSVEPRGARASGLLPRWAIATLLALSAGAAASPAAGADVSAENRVAAQVLFDQGKELSKDGRWAEACPKFEESQRLDPRIATQFKLADCFEHVGRTASAWANFLDVISATKAAGQADREQVARERAAALEKKMSRLVIQVKGSRPAGLRVTRDGSEVGSPQWGTAVPIDPGSHVVGASAPGKRPWQSSAAVPDSAATITINVPDLIDDPGALAPPPVAPGPGQPPPLLGGPAPQPDRPDEGGSQRTAGWVLAGAGVVGLGVGAAFGLIAKSKWDSATPNCVNKDLCNPAGVSLAGDARSAATVSTVAFLAGGALLATGLIVRITAPSRPAPAGAGFVPLVGPQLAGGALVGAF